MSFRVYNIEDAAKGFEDAANSFVSVLVPTEIVTRREESTLIKPRFRDTDDVRVCEREIYFLNI
jgi:hypothetical protein